MNQGKPLNTTAFIDILPESLQHDNTIQSAAKALDSEFSVIDSAIPTLSLWNRIESMTEPELSTLAGQFSLIDEPVWGQAEEDETKRTLLQGALELHRYKGTPWSIREVMRTLGYGEIELIEGIGNLYYDGTGEYDGVYTYGQENAWAIYDIVMGKRLSAAEERALRATLLLIAPARCHLDQFLPLYKANLMLSVSQQQGTPVASGQIKANWSPIKAVWVTLVATPAKGSALTFQVMSDTTGNYESELPLPPGRWSIRAFATVYDPLEQAIEVKSATEYIDVEAHPTAIIPEKTEIWLLPGEEKTLSVTVLPEEATDKTFTVTTTSPAVTCTTTEDSITVKGVDFCDAEIVLTTTVGGQKATIQVRVVAGAKVDMLLTSYLQPIFYSNVGDDDIDNIWLDWGDGKLIQDYRVATGEGGNPVYPIEPRELNKTYTLTIYNSDEVTFGRSRGLVRENRVTKLHQVSGTRTGLDYFLYNQKALTEIAVGALAFLPHLTHIRYLLAQSGITRLPEDFLAEHTEIEDASYAFYYSQLTELPRQFLQRATKLHRANSMLRRSPLTHLPDGIFKACAASLGEMEDMLAFCNQLTSDVNAMFSAEHYPRLTKGSDAFYNCFKMTGSALAFIDKCPVLRQERVFATCTSLSDYNDIPNGWK